MTIQYLHMELVAENPNSNDTYKVVKTKQAM